jgi:Carbonic anhydrase
MENVPRVEFELQNLFKSQMTDEGQNGREAETKKVFPTMGNETLLHKKLVELWGTSTTRQTTTLTGGYKRDQHQQQILADLYHTRTKSRQVMIPLSNSCVLHPAIFRGLSTAASLRSGAAVVVLARPVVVVSATVSSTSNFPPFCSNNLLYSRRSFSGTRTCHHKDCGGGGTKEDPAIETLMQHNRAWVDKTNQIDPDFFPQLGKGQSPEYLYIGCSDSRVAISALTGLSIGEVFVHRNIANMVVSADLNLLSVLTYAVDHLKVKHSTCLLLF